MDHLHSATCSFRRAWAGIVHNNWDGPQNLRKDDKIENNNNKDFFFVIFSHNKNKYWNFLRQGYNAIFFHLNSYNLLVIIFKIEKGNITIFLIFTDLKDEEFV